ncbi:hypothetical protein GCM10027073_24660 [Streptomyces chlorus]
MPEHDSILRVTGATVLTLVAVACTVGLAGVLRRDRRRVRGSGVGLRTRMRTLARAGAQWGPGGPGRRDEDVGPRPHQKSHRKPHPESKPGRDVPGPQEPPALRTIPRQRRTGPRAEQVRLTPAEREAFAVLVRRFTGGREGR